MIAIIEGVEFEVADRAEALASASILDDTAVTVRFFNLRFNKVQEEHYRLVEGQWFAYYVDSGLWVAVDAEALVIHPETTRTDLGDPTKAAV